MEIADLAGKGCMEDKYIKEALSHYNIDPNSEVIFLRHNENITFRVGTDYLLQIHEPVEGFQTQFIYERADRMAVYETELRFLAYLKKQGLIIREPVENRSGEWITRLNSGITATVFRWIEGVSLDKVEWSDEYCYQIGALTADLHRCAKGFHGSPAISYDEKQCERIKEKIGERQAGSELNSAYFKTMQRACDAVGAYLRKLHNGFQMLHADLSLSNILLTKSGLAAIDFSLFGMGHPMFDLATLFGNINGLRCRQIIAEGYRNAGGVFDYRALDACFVLTILGGITIHFEQWSKQDWFAGRMERWCRESFEPFSAGERLYADDFYLIHAG